MLFCIWYVSDSWLLQDCAWDHGSTRVNKLRSVVVAFKTGSNLQMHADDADDMQRTNAE